MPRVKRLAALIALLLTARLAVFMVDATRAQYTLAPWSKFHRVHCCFTSYVAGAVLARARVANIYDVALYDGRVGLLELDNYEYPPPFLLLPAIAVALTKNFFLMRAVWFFLEAALFALALHAVVRFARASPTLSALVWISPPTLICLQIGNFHVLAIAVAMLAMIAIARDHEILGAALLAFITACKIYSGILIVYLIVQRRWRAVKWIAAFGLLLVALSWLVFGSAPLVEFVRYQIPRISNAEAFPWVEHSEGVLSVNITATNFSYYGLVTKLRMFGLPGMGPATARSLGWIATAGIVLAAVLLGRAQRDHNGPMAAASGWLVLINLASLRSPFCPSEYATIGTLWLLALMGTGLERRLRTMSGFALLWMMVALACAWPPGKVRLVLASIGHLALLGANVWMIVRLAGGLRWKPGRRRELASVSQSAAATT